MLKESVVVVIPVYKSFSALTPSEKGSLAQCFSILNKRTICIIGPENLNFPEYLQFAKSNTIGLNIKTFKNNYFKTIKGYNKLLLSKKFYEKFSLWKYILIYQLDAWVFSDQLDFWTGQGYDFIGAPLFEGFHKGNSIHFVRGLNGGLSLRSVETSIRLIKRMEKLRCLLFIMRLFSFFAIRTLKPFFFLFHFKEKYYIKSFEKLHAAIIFRNLNEDYYWSKFLEEAFVDYKVPTSLIALKFSFELNSAYLYALNDMHLPFGCHAWEKYDPRFWQRFI